MSNTARIVTILLLLSALIGGAYYFLDLGASEPPPAPPAPVATNGTPEQSPTPAPVTAPPAQAPQPADRTEAPSHLTLSDAPQGVRGRVLLPDGTIGAGIEVLLVTNVMSNPTNIFLMNKTNKGIPPLASGTTAADGTFALGLRQPDQMFDLRILSPDHPEKNLARLKVREGDWFNAGDIRLDVGLVVTGRVVENGSNAPVPGATVFMVNSNQSHAMLATPGRERGIPTETDHTGFFRFTNAPSLGTINLSVEAQGYASSPRVNLALQAQGVNDFTLEVVRGAPITGVVVDAKGKPIAGVTVNATGLSTKTPQNATAVSGADGAFHFENLRAGPYTLMATMGGYLDAQESLVMSGDSSVKLVLGTRAFVKVRVLAASGAPVKTYRVSLTRYFPNNQQGVGKVMDFPDYSVAARDYPTEFGGTWAVLRGLPPGEFRLMISDDTHAKTLSEPFAIVDGGDAPEVTVQMTLGGVIRGIVVDNTGRPVADATVTTDMNSGVAGDLGGLFDMFRQMMPEKHTKASVKTNAEGRFRFAKLSFAEYMVRVTHPNFCEGTALSIRLETPGQELDVGAIRLELGALVEGVTTVAGEPQGQVQVTVSSPISEIQNARDPARNGGRDPSAPMPVMFHSKAISTGDGRYRLLKRVPPGNYRITASRQSGENPFGAIVDIKETEQQLAVAPGQERIEINFNLSKR